MGPRERRIGAGALLLLFTLVLAYWTNSLASGANADVVRAVYYAAAALIGAIGIVVWASR